jgi:hypothetical protein
MEDMEYAWADMRSMNSGWKETFRLRFTGWIPQDWADEGFRNCVFVAKDGGPPFELDLTAKGRNLTDPNWGKYSPETFERIFGDLLFFGYDEAWLSPPRDAEHFFICKSDMFSKNFIASLLSIARAHISSEGKE